ncbi:MAG: DUF364 domain-containing protein [Clostridia bacterium]|jgi:uncharacterized protein (DUF4213/DUF364 family)|nr:DUF364 domain-containing protein [Clostridia bacterium]
MHPSFKSDIGKPIATVESTADFEEAYLQIRRMYDRFGLTAGKLERIGFRNKWNHVLAEGDQAGLAFNFTADHAVYGPVEDMEPFIQLQPYIGQSLFRFTEALLPRKEIQMRSLCLAALNALSQPLLERSCLESRGIPSPDMENYDFIRPEDVVAIVGFGGVFGKIYNRCRQLHITDMRPKYLLQTLTIDSEIRYGPGKIIFHGEKENEAVLSAADVIIMTGCTLINGSYLDLIRYSRKARIIGMFGPSAAILPEYLLGCGIRMISSQRALGGPMREPQFEYAADLSGLFQSMLQPYFIYDPNPQIIDK